jgi:hypothetical protein
VYNIHLLEMIDLLEIITVPDRGSEASITSIYWR